MTERSTGRTRANDAQFGPSVPFRHAGERAGITVTDRLSTEVER
jgi:hypothetical protein